MRDFAPLGTVTRLLLLVLEKGYSRDACTDVDAKYDKRRGSAQGSAFWGSRNQNLRQIGVVDSKYVIVFDPLLTGHVIRRIRSGRGCIFNANQWKTL